MGKRIVSDIFIWIFSAVICILWRLVADKSTILAYVALFGAMAVVWVILGLIFYKYYRSYREAWYWQELLSLLLTGGS